MNILLLGSGGREHALAWAISNSAQIETLYAAPGNAGIAECATIIELDMADHAAVISFCKHNEIDLVVVGPEAPLVVGIVDDLNAAGIRAFGPTKLAAQLEGSKGFTKDICANYNIPTAAYGRFKDPETAKSYIREQGAPIVVKADGLAAGKGVIMAMTLDEALHAIDDCFGGSFGEAGHEVVVEEFMEGEEASFFALCDGQNTLALASAQDHKRVGDGDAGLNTGGMGAYSPAPVMSEAMNDEVMTKIIEPTVRAMSDMGHPYKGVLFAGLMITEDGPKLIEHNCRFGDPECQVLMMRLKDDILTLLNATVDGLLDKVTARWFDETALSVVLASKGYPGSYDKNTPIDLQNAQDAENVEIFHAGTAMKNGELVATGGRVLNVTAMGTSVKEAQRRAYKAVDKINWPNGFCRRDIGWRAID
ncbi:MAG: phosphoribosylamine--glycine ligase [Hyphomicrobiales bacterium]